MLHVSQDTHAAGKNPLRSHCPECMRKFAPRQVAQLFCSGEHKAAFHNRATVRGRQLTPLVMAARITRGGHRKDPETGIHARRDAEHLMDQWVADDSAAGRMSMVDYVRLRRAKGFERP